MDEEGMDGGRKNGQRRERDWTEGERMDGVRENGRSERDRWAPAGGSSRGLRPALRPGERDRIRVVRVREIGIELSCGCGRWVPGGERDMIRVVLVREIG